MVDSLRIWPNVFINNDLSDLCKFQLQKVITLVEVKDK